jgi:hypothetical protein
MVCTVVNSASSMPTLSLLVLTKGDDSFLTIVIWVTTRAEYHEIALASSRAPRFDHQWTAAGNRNEDSAELLAIQER